MAYFVSTSGSVKRLGGMNESNESERSSFVSGKRGTPGDGGTSMLPVMLVMRDILDRL